MTCGGGVQGCNNLVLTATAEGVRCWRDGGEVLLIETSLELDLGGGGGGGARLGPPLRWGLPYKWRTLSEFWIEKFAGMLVSFRLKGLGQFQMKSLGERWSVSD